VRKDEERGTRDKGGRRMRKDKEGRGRMRKDEGQGGKGKEVGRRGLTNQKKKSQVTFPSPGPCSKFRKILIWKSRAETE
jgi:hypothetical protein